MTQQIKDIIQNTKEIYMSDSNLSTLMNFERVLDELDLYVFKNWKQGELVEGPVYEKYFVTCSFMWPHKLMPDPRGAVRLLGYKCEVSYKKSKLSVSVDVKSEDDFEPGTKMPKMKDIPIWVVTIVMPKDLMQEMLQGSLELESETLDLEDLDAAYEEGNDDATQQQDDTEDLSDEAFT